MAAVKPTIVEHRLSLAEVLDWLVEDGLVAGEAADQLKKERRYYKGSSHPLLMIADQKWKSLQAPHRLHSVESLTEWMARRVGLEYMHIDPLKIDFSAVTEVMSSATSSNSSSLARPTSNSTQTTPILSGSWTGSGSTLLSKGRATYTSSRAGNWASCDSGSTECCIRCTRFQRSCRLR